MTGDTWTDRLSEYLDGELTASETLALESHLQECAACRADLEELQAVVARLSADPVTAGDQPTLREWLAIRRALRTTRRRLVTPLALAASLALMAVAGGLWSLRGPGQSEAPRVPAPAPGPAAYREAAVDLEAILRENRGRLDPQTLQVLEASLAMIDSAIAQAERALIADPANDYVTRHVGQLLDARLLTLRQAVAVARARS